MKFICIPGLGFTNEIFQNIDFNSCHVEYLNWIEPLENEDLSEYVIRLTEGMLFDENTILLGHSFGGVIAQEIAHRNEVRAIILLSTLRHSYEKPFKITSLSTFKLSSIVTKNLILSTFPFWSLSHGYDSVESRELFRKMINSHSTTYIRWGMEMISRWDEVSLKESKVYRIHGSKDMTFPPSLIREKYFEIKDGSHFMVYTKADQVSTILHKIVLEIES